MTRFFLLSFVAAGHFLNAQSIGNSPYAAFGIGDVKYDNTADINAMGGISTAYINDFTNKFNFSNPAANANLDLASFNVEGTNENSFYKSNFSGLNAKKHSTYLSNLSLAFPISHKVKFGVGYQPYSSKGYSIVSTATLADGSVQVNRFNGSGSVSTLQAALSYNITPAFAIGVRSNLYFGTLYDLEETTLSNSDLVNGLETTNKLSTINYTIGSTFQKKSENDRKFTVGATYTFGASGTMDNTFRNSTYFYSGTDKANETTIAEVKRKDNNVIPMSASLGLGYGHDGRWFVSTQGDYRKGESISFQGKPFQYDDGYRVAAGGWYLPNYNNFRNYFSRVIYRFGAYYEKGNLSVNGGNSANLNSVNKFAVTGGVMLPFANSSINRLNGIDLGLEIGQRGTLSNNMIRENFVNLRVGLTFADKWFQKRQYD